jgi:hypothetical protein
VKSYFLLRFTFIQLCWSTCPEKKAWLVARPMIALLKQCWTVRNIVASRRSVGVNDKHEEDMCESKIQILLSGACSQLALVLLSVYESSWYMVRLYSISATPALRMPCDAIEVCGHLENAGTGRVIEDIQHSGYHRQWSFLFSVSWESDPDTRYSTSIWYS